jgi:hypothetical protein
MKISRIAEMGTCATNIPVIDAGAAVGNPIEPTLYDEWS